jgi:hypothetical protein
LTALWRMRRFLNGPVCGSLSVAGGYNWAYIIRPSRHKTTEYTMISGLG